MKAVRAHFDGARVLLPEGMKGVPPGPVIVVFEDGAEREAEATAWTAAQEESFAAVWDNEDDAIYDTL